MNQEMTRLAMAIHSNPGVYAVLLGSGISRPAGIPTGWDVVEDLIRKISIANGEDCQTNPVKWFDNQFQEEPTYSGLLNRVAKTPAERSCLLRKYFEPEDDEEDGPNKRPTQAHIALANLAKRGYIRVILTTNFDRLMEHALGAVGLEPTVISTPQAVEGATPLPHSPCTVIKLHGDYLDLRTKNTPVELSKYDKRIERLLNRILDEYGLIICGWSGEWDEALKNAIYRRKNRRFSTWWTTVTPLTDDGQRVVEFCQADVLTIAGADSFFENLSECVSALAEFDRPNPESKRLKITLLKRYLSEEKYRIKLHDLVHDETEKLVLTLQSKRLTGNGPYAPRQFADLLPEVDAALDVLASMIATGARWTRTEEQVDLWEKCIGRVANASAEAPRKVHRAFIHLYSAIFLTYATGVAFAGQRNLNGIYQIIENPKLREGRAQTALIDARNQIQYWDKIFSEAQQLGGSKLPFSFYLFDKIRTCLGDLFPDPEEYKSSFDLFEIACSFSVAFYRNWAQPGIWMHQFDADDESSPYAVLKKRVDELGEQSEFLKAGFCNGNMRGYLATRARVEKALTEYSW